MSTEEATHRITKELQERYPDVGIRSIEVDEVSGKSTFYLDPTKKSLAYLDGREGISAVQPTHRATAATVRRDAVDRTTLDLSIAKDAYDITPQEAIKRAIRYHHTEPLVGSTNTLLANLAAKGFENDIDDADIKNFYDTWIFDVNFEELIEWVFLEFFKTGNATTYKVLQKYEPRVSTISPAPGQKPKKAKSDKELAAKKKTWSKGHMPIAYTVLNPELVEVTGSLLFDKNSLTLTLPPELLEVLKKDKAELSNDELELVKNLPTEIKSAAESGDPLLLESDRVGRITYRKQPYERYARPRTARIFDTIEYKKALRQADLSTLDGISNYILKITIGSDEFPVTSQNELEAVAQLFNTPSKSFDVVWNHTLNVEKIVSPEIESILGQEKYGQVNDDLTAGLSITRAIIDGKGDINAAEVSLVVKGLMEEINYARRQVTRWIYNEYRQIAEAMGFDRFPKVRWDEAILKDTILYMSTLAQMVDRRMLSYRTSLEALGFDYDNELFNMEEEQALVEAGTFGIIGSPWQQAKTQGEGAPTGTPSSGRPKAKPAKPKEKETNPAKKTKKPPKTESNVTVQDIVAEMSEEQFSVFMKDLIAARTGN